MSTFILALLSALVLNSTVYCTGSSWFTNYGNEEIDGLKETMFSRYKRQAVMQNDPTKDENELLPEFPHIVSIVPEKGRMLCLGVLISESLVLAPGNCLAFNELFYVKINGKRLKISKKILHPMYSTRSTLYDIGMLKIEINDDTRSNIQPACLWEDDTLSIPNIKMAGTRASLLLNKTTSIRVLSAENCKLYYDYAFSSQGSSLVDHQMCVFYDFEEHWKWRSKIIYADVIENDFIVSFVIGIPSFFVSGDSQKFDVFIQLSKFHEWIAETMHKEGVSFQSWQCFRRHSNERRRIESAPKFMSNNTREFMVIIYESSDVSKECEGALISTDVVITLAQCASNLIVHSSSVLFYSRRRVSIRDIIIHPNYMENSLYNNIAILKLESKVPFVHAQLEPYYFKDHKILMDCSEDNNFGYIRYSSVDDLSLLFSYECEPSEEQRSRLSKGLLLEHMCIRKLKPIATHNCASKLGSPIYWVRNDTNYLMGLYMLGENCAIAEQAVVLYVYAHINWINSVINSTSSASLAVFIPSLKLTDECSYPDSTTGTCVSQTSCTSIYKRIESYLPIIYCNSRAIVCCPLEDEDILFAAFRN
ncbi:uncharacterized protein LOC133393333 isoform X1 [Anopheles gambiae]|uniref:Peptidase S1 domain-containing protein n=2 Tax=Anopheles coluzzii TaxID=1518534 RepID=A0A6E8WCV6_ANOCL|nr:uncharacterized protein LOC120958935 isoform X1 [Anopheles coluzzii]XP_061513873.1 uncharacterized protein LOC133393333 isoform X1 [Anopheles gambiae]